MKGVSFLFCLAHTPRSLSCTRYMLACASCRVCCIRHIRTTVLCIYYLAYCILCIYLTYVTLCMLHLVFCLLFMISSYTKYMFRELLIWRSLSCRWHLLDGTSLVESAVPSWRPQKAGGDHTLPVWLSLAKAPQKRRNRVCASFVNCLLTDNALVGKPVSCLMMGCLGYGGG